LSTGWSTLTRGEQEERPARSANAIYDHGFAANFDGYDVWGELRYRLTTDCLGFKDGLVREISFSRLATGSCFGSLQKARSDASVEALFTVPPAR